MTDIKDILPFITGGIWATTPIDEVPELELCDWSVRELPNGDRHFVGYNVTEREGRVSSKIVEFDLEKMLGKTKTGRVYKLLGESGFNMDAEYVWGAWKSINKVSDYRVLHEEELKKEQAK